MHWVEGKAVLRIRIFPESEHPSTSSSTATLHLGLMARRNRVISLKEMMNPPDDDLRRQWKKHYLNRRRFSIKLRGEVAQSQGLESTSMTGPAAKHDSRVTAPPEDVNVYRTGARPIDLSMAGAPQTGGDDIMEASAVPSENLVVLHTPVEDDPSISPHPVAPQLLESWCPQSGTEHSPPFSPPREDSVRSPSPVVGTLVKASWPGLPWSCESPPRRDRTSPYSKAGLHRDRSRQGISEPSSSLSANITAPSPSIHEVAPSVSIPLSGWQPTHSLPVALAHIPTPGLSPPVPETTARSHAVEDDPASLDCPSPGSSPEMPPANALPILPPPPRESIQGIALLPNAPLVPFTFTPPTRESLQLAAPVPRRKVRFVIKTITPNVEVPNFRRDHHQAVPTFSDEVEASNDPQMSATTPLSFVQPGAASAVPAIDDVGQSNANIQPGNHRSHPPVYHASVLQDRDERTTSAEALAYTSAHTTIHNINSAGCSSSGETAPHAPLVPSSSLAQAADGMIVTPASLPSSSPPEAPSTAGVSPPRSPTGLIPVGDQRPFRAGAQDGYTRWWHTWAPYAITHPLLDVPVRPGDLFLHTHTITGNVQSWLWRDGWQIATEGDAHPVVHDRVLWFRDKPEHKPEPSWVTPHTFSTYRSRQRKSERMDVEILVVMTE